MIALDLAIFSLTVSGYILVSPTYVWENAKICS